MAEKPVFPATQLECTVGRPKLGPAIGEIAEDFAAHGCGPLSFRLIVERVQVTGALLVVNQPPVIRVYQAEFPQLVTLVNVGNTWNRNLEHYLGQGVHGAE
jgi:hypothetical protein